MLGINELEAEDGRLFGEADGGFTGFIGASEKDIPGPLVALPAYRGFNIQPEPNFLGPVPLQRSFSQTSESCTELFSFVSRVSGLNWL